MAEKDVKKKEATRDAEKKMALELFKIILITIGLMVGGSVAIGIICMVFGVYDKNIIGGLGFFNGFYIYVTYTSRKLRSMLTTHTRTWADRIKEIDREPEDKT